MHSMYMTRFNLICLLLNCYDDSSIHEEGPEAEDQEVLHLEVVEADHEATLLAVAESRLPLQVAPLDAAVVESRGGWVYNYSLPTPSAAVIFIMPCLNKKNSPSNVNTAVLFGLFSPLSPLSCVFIQISIYLMKVWINILVLMSFYCRFSSAVYG